MAEGGDFNNINSTGGGANPEDVARLHEGKRLVANNWYVGETLGKGGFGFVKLGYLKSNNTPFALKFIKKDESSKARSERQNRLILTEINCLIKVRNPYVLRLFACKRNCEYPQSNGSKLNTIMLVLELATGGDLFDILYYCKKLDVDLARTYFYQLSEGLAAIHEAGICHRDLKPQNLLLNDKFQLKITDFGLSRIFEEDERQVMRTYHAGTKGYQSPEQILKRKFTPKCDVFACGVILFALLTGYPPCHQAHYNDSFYKYIAHVKYENFWVKHRLNKKFDEETKDIVVKCLCYQPADRITSREMLEHKFTQSERRLTDAQLFEKMKNLRLQSIKLKSQDSAKMEKLRGASANFRDVPGLDKFGPIPTYTGDVGRLLTQGLVFELKKDSGEHAREMFQRLEDLATVKKGHLKFEKNNDASEGEYKWEAILKLCFETYRTVLNDDDEEERETLAKIDKLAFVNLYRSPVKVDGREPLFITFRFPGEQLNQGMEEANIYEDYGGFNEDYYSEEIVNMIPEQRDQLIAEMIVVLQQIGDVDLSDEQAAALAAKYTTAECPLTAQVIMELSQEIETNPMEFTLPSMFDYVVKHLTDFLNLDDENFIFKMQSSQKDVDYDDATVEELAKFMEEDELWEEALKEKRVVTEDTHGYSLQEDAPLEVESKKVDADTA